MPVNNVIKLRRGDDWSNNPVLAEGEPGFDTTNNILKVGDGTTAWNDLNPIGSGLNYLQSHPNISAAASSSDNSGRTYIQDVLLDDNGHVIGLSTATESGSTVETDTLATVTARGNSTTTNCIIPFYYANQAAFPSATTYHGAIAHSHSDGAMYFAHGGAWHRLANSDDPESNDLSSSVTWANVPDTNITESSVIQHTGAFRVTESQIVDLQNYLTSFTETNDLSSAVTWTNVPDANITESSVVQHTGAFTIKESQVVDLKSYLTSESNDLSAAVVWANVPDSNITESSVVQHTGALLITESQIVDLQNYLTSHPTIASAASSSDNSGRTYIQDILLDSNGHVIGITTATETVTDTNTEYTAGTGLSLESTEFNINPDLINSRTEVTSEDSDYLLIWDATDSQLKKVDAGEFRGGGGGATLTQEEVEDFVGGMVTGNTETGITVTYQDADGTLDFVVASQTDENFTTADHSKLDGIEAGADVTDTANVTSAGALMDSEVTNLSQVKAFDSSDYATAAQGTKADTAQQPPSEGAFVDGDKTKLDGIEASADVTDTANVNAAGAVMNSDTTTVDMSFVIDEDNMTSNSDTKVPTQQSVKAYVDANGGGGGISNIVEDTTPQLGGNLDAQSNNISSVGSLTATSLIKSGGTSSQFLKADGSVDTNTYLTSFTETNDLSAAVTWTNVPDANITQGSVTQHQAALSITESQISDLQSYLTSYTETDTLANVTSRGNTTTTTCVIPFLYANQAAFPNASTYHGAIAHSHSDGAMYFAHGGNWIKLANDSDILNEEKVEDFVGGMLTGNTETGITVTYDDSDGTIDFVVASQTDENFTTADHSKLDGIEAGADVTDTTNVTTAGALMDSEVTNLSQVKAFDSSDYATAAQGTKADSAQQPPSEGAFVDGDKTKLDGIEANADVTDTANVTSAGALMDSELTDLAGVKGVTISTLQVKPSEGAFADGDKTKLDAIEAGANVTDATNVDAAGAVMNSDTSTASMSFVVDEDNMSSDSDTKVPTQQSVKAFVENAGYLTAHPNISAANSSDNSGNTFIQDITLDSNGHVTDIAVATATDGGGGGGISNVVEDTTPQLGGDLGLNSKDITGTGHIDITGSGHFSAKVEADSFVKDGGTSSQFLKADGSVDTNTYSTTDTQLTEEQVEDFVGGMVTGNTETGITVTYDDSDGTLDFVVASQTDENFTTADHAKLDGIEASADVTDTANVTSAGALMDSEVTNLSQVKAFDSSDYATAAQGTKADSAQQPPSEGAFANGDKTKLDGIEASADVTDTANVTSAGALMDSEVTNLAQVKAFDSSDYATAAQGTKADSAQQPPSEGAFVDGDKTKLDAIEANATADQTDEEIQDIVGAMLSSNTETGITVTYQDADGTIDFVVSSQTDENFTTADHSKLDGIEASADVTDTANVTSAGALMDSELASIADVKALDQSVIAGASPNFATTNMTDASDKRFMTDAQETKLDSVESSADVTDTANVTAAGALMDSELTDLAGVKGVTISTLQSKPSEGAFANGDKTKLDGIEANATADQTDEEIQDIVGAMVSSNTETGITVTYQDADGTLDFVVDHDAANNFVANEHIDHTSVTLTAGDGLTGGGDISANRTFAVSVDDSTIEINSDALRIKDGAITSAKIGAGGFVFNEAGASVDFRVEGDTDANLLFIDGSTDRVGIGTNAPAYLLDVDGAIGADSITVGESNKYLSMLRSTGGTFGIGRIHELLGTFEVMVGANTAAVEITNHSVGSPVVTINPAGIDMDFIVEGDTDTDLLFCDAGNDIVQIGKLNINGAFTLPTTDGSANQILKTDGSGNVSWAADGGSGSSLTEEEVEDFVGGMVTGNTETFITVTYEDSDGTLDFVVPVKDEDNMASDSATHLATQQSIKAYVDANAGGGSTSVAAISANATISSDVNLVTTANTDRTVTLPSVSSGKIVRIKKVDAGTGTVIIARSGSSTIDGATQVALYSQFESMTIICDGTNWHVF